MKLNTRNSIILVLLCNLILAIGFYLDNISSGYSILINDVHSIIGIGHKFDDNTLFQEDLFLNSIKNVEYYTPFFVQPMRFFAEIMNYDYLQGLNLFGFITNILFGLFWFLLFCKFFKNFWIAFLLSFIVRGVVWLPGGEIWGVGELWTIMPRTIYITLMPLPFLLLESGSKFKLLVSAFLIGLVFNFHPITGLGGIILYITICVLYYWFYKPQDVNFIRYILLIIAAIFFGMLPFIVTYFSKTESTFSYDLGLYQKAFLKRIPSYFEDPTGFLKLWLKPSLLSFFIVLITYLIISINNVKELKKASILLFCSMILLFTSNVAIYIENFINSVSGLNLRMAFQFIRLQKLAILPAYFAIGFIIIKFFKQKRYYPVFVIVFIIFILVSKSNKFDNLPLIGDGITRTILPNSLSLYKNNNRNYLELDQMMEYISKNTPIDAVFIGPSIIRSATRRSIKLDYKGASAIIEGNPEQFIQWYIDRTKFESLLDQDKEIFLKNHGVDYILIPAQKDYQQAKLEKKIGKWHLYKL